MSRRKVFHDRFEVIGVSWVEDLWFFFYCYFTFFTLFLFGFFGGFSIILSLSLWLLGKVFKCMLIWFLCGKQCVLLCQLVLISDLLEARDSLHHRLSLKLKNLSGSLLSYSRKHRSTMFSTWLHK